jgi:hypothetical protein
MSIDLQVQVHGGYVSLDDHMRLTLSLVNMTALLEVRRSPLRQQGHFSHALASS